MNEPMGNQEEFLKKVEAALKLRIGAIIAGSILKNNLSKMNKTTASLTREDCQVLVDNIVKAVSLFEAKDESKLVQNDLESLLNTLRY